MNPNTVVCGVNGGGSGSGGRGIIYGDDSSTRCGSSELMNASEYTG